MTSDSIKRKIAALLKMNSASGCTEAEAMAAAEKAAALMREYGLSEADLTIGKASTRAASKGQGIRDQLWCIVAFCTNTASTFVHETGKRGADIVFIGPDPGPEIAAYLVTVLNRAIDGSIAVFKSEPFYRRRKTDATRRAAVRDFTAGMVGRLSRRLVDVFGPSIDKRANALAVAARDQLFAGAKPISGPELGKPRFASAALSGWSAGGKVNLAHGVQGGATERRQIGG